MKRSESHLRKLFEESYKALINLPLKNDNETEIFNEFEFHDGSLKFEGQNFDFPKGFKAETLTRWLEENLLLVEIKISAEIQAECARCLKETNLEISEKLGYLYHLGSAENEDFDDEDYMPVEVEYFGRVIDIMPQIEESVFAILPTKVLCKEDCKGLCPNCGKNLNEGSCSCSNENIDPRFEALRNFVIE